MADWFFAHFSRYFYRHIQTRFPFSSSSFPRSLCARSQKLPGLTLTYLLIRCNCNIMQSHFNELSLTFTVNVRAGIASLEFNWDRETAEGREREEWSRNEKV